MLLRKESVGTDLQTERPSIADALNQAEYLIESSQYRAAREKLQEISRNFQLSHLSQGSCRFHYLRGLLSFRLGELPTAWVEIEEAFRIFKVVNASVSLPERENLSDFVKENLRKLRDVEIALLAGLQEPDGKENIEKGEALTERISEISNSLENLSPLAKMHYFAGCIKLNLAKLDEATEHLERAATASMLSRDWSGLAKSLNGIALVHFHKGGFEQSLQVTERAIAYSRKAGDRHFETILRSNLANCQLWLGLWRPSISSLPEILAEIKKFKDTPNYCGALLYWGHANLLRGHLKESERAFRESLRLATEHNLIRFLKMAHSFYALFYVETGQYSEAENHLKKALETTRRETPSDSGETAFWRFLGDVHAAQNQFEKARKAYAACQNCLAKFPQKDEEAAMCRGMGAINARQGLLPTARRNFKKALDLFEVCGSQWEKAKTLVVAAESAVFTQVEMEPEIAWAKDVFKKLEHPAWAKRARSLLKKAKNSGGRVPLPLARERTERAEIARALSETEGNVTQAAKKLGLLRQTLQYKIRHYGIEF